MREETTRRGKREEGGLMEGNNEANKSRKTERKKQDSKKVKLGTFSRVVSTGDALLHSRFEGREGGRRFKVIGKKIPEQGSLGFRSIAGKDRICCSNERHIPISSVIVMRKGIDVKKIIIQKILREKPMMKLIHEGCQLKFVNIMYFQS